MRQWKPVPLLAYPNKPWPSLSFTVWVGSDDTAILGLKTLWIGWQNSSFTYQTITLFLAWALLFLLCPWSPSLDGIPACCALPFSWHSVSSFTSSLILDTFPKRVDCSTTSWLGNFHTPLGSLKLLPASLLSSLPASTQQATERQLPTL